MTELLGAHEPLPRPLHPRGAGLVVLCAIVLVYRVVAWLHPSSFVVIPPSVALPLNGLGVLYLVCGVWAWMARPSYLTRVFLVSGIGGGIHWGGSIAAQNHGLELALLVFYVGVTAIGDAAFLDFALRYPHPRPRRGLAAFSLYALGTVTLCTLPFAPFVSNRVAEAGLGFVIMVAFIMSIAGGVVFLVKLLRATAAQRREQSLVLIAIALVVPSGLDLLAESGALPGVPEAWALAYAVVPVTFAWVLVRASH